MPGDSADAGIDRRWLIRHRRRSDDTIEEPFRFQGSQVSLWEVTENETGPPLFMGNANILETIRHPILRFQNIRLR